MVQYIPISDSFDASAGFAWGGFLANYLRCVPWPNGAPPAIGAYNLPMAEGTLNQGYKAGHGGVAFTDTGTPAVPDGFCATLWRATYNSAVEGQAVFKLATTAGTATDDSFRAAGLCLRAQSGTFNDTWQHERVFDHSAYWVFILNTLAQGVSFLFVRVNSGVPTLLATVTALSMGQPSTALAFFGANGRQLRFAIGNNGSGNPVMAAYIANADGTGEVQIGSNITDSTAQKLATPGRIGFGMTRDRVESGSNRTATVCTYFQVRANTQLQLRDEWTRTDAHGKQSFSSYSTPLTDGNGIVGHRSQQHWVCDLFGQHQQQTPGSGNQNGLRRMQTDPGNNRLRVPWSGTPAIPGATFPLMGTSVVPVDCGKCLDWSITVTYLNPAPAPTRGQNGPGAANNLLLRVWGFGSGSENGRFFLSIQYRTPPLPHPAVPVWYFFAFGNDTHTVLEPDAGPLGMGLAIPITYRCVITETGTAPTRLWVVEWLVNGVRIPFPATAITPPDSTFLVNNGDGTYSWSEALAGALSPSTVRPQFSVQAYGTVVGTWPSGNYDDLRLDEYFDQSPACCTLEPVPSAVPVVLEIPPVQLTVQVGATEFLPTSAQIVVEIPSPVLTVQVGVAEFLPTPDQIVVEVPSVVLTVQVGVATFLPTPVQEVVSVPSVVLTVQVGQTSLLVQPVQVVLSPPGPQLTVVTPTTSVPAPTQVVVQVPEIRVLTGDDRRDPAGQIKFAGAVIGEARFAGPAASEVG